MSRSITVGAAQLGPIARNDSRQQVVGRLIELMRQAKSSGCDLVVYPELALTTFFPRWYFSDQEEIDFFFEREIPGPATRPLFAEAQKLALGFCIGYAEFAREGGTKAKIGVWGYGEGGMLALYAGALDTRIGAVTVSG